MPYKLNSTKKLFLKIAFHFIGKEKNYTLRLHQDSDISLESKLRFLGCRCLVTVDCSNRLTKHDIIKEMGREIVRKQSFEEPGEYSGLWSQEDGFGVSKYHTVKIRHFPNYFKKKKKNHFSISKSSVNKSKYILIRVSHLCQVYTLLIALYFN